MLNTQDESRVRIAKVDCTENQKTCSSNEVTSYPTLKFFKLNSEEEPVKYRSTRDLPSLTQFINDQLGSSTPEVDESDENLVVPAPLKGLITLSDKNFAEQTATGNWFIKFYAPWCKLSFWFVRLNSFHIVYSLSRWSLPEIGSRLRGTWKSFGTRHNS
jgi:Thioredoxin